MVRIGLMGAGVVASYGHIPAILRTPDLQLKAVLEPDVGRLIETKAHFQIPNGYTDAELFFQSGIDAVVITSPAPTHRQNVLLAAKYGKAVLCEKPIAMDEADAQFMIDAMKEAGQPFYIGFTYRYAAPALQIKRLVDSGAIGRVQSLRLIYLWDCHGAYSPRHAIDSPNQHRLARMIEGGPMVDCGVHQIDLARWWLGSDVVRHTGHGAWIDDHAAPDHVWLHLDHASGAHCMVEMSYSYAHTSVDNRVQFVYELIGSKGVIRYDRQTRLFEVVSGSGTTHLPWSEEKNFDGMYADFLKAMKTGRPDHLATAEDGLIATRIARQATDAVIRSRIAAPKANTAAVA